MRALAILAAVLIDIPLIAHAQPQPPMLTGALAFTCDASGSEVDNERWDTVTARRLFNLWFCSGVPVGTPDGLLSPFINGPSNAQAAINLPLTIGTHDYTVFAALNDPAFAYYGLNLFFNGNRLPSISAKTAIQLTNSSVPLFAANDSTNTYALDDIKAPAAGTLSYSDGPWTVTMTRFTWAHPTVFESDRITRGLTGAPGGFTLPDGVPDFVTSFTLVVTERSPSLSITLVTNRAVIVWPSWASGYQLEAANDLPAVSGWNGITNQPVAVGDDIQIVLPISEPHQFYRLSKPL